MWWSPFLLIVAAVRAQNGYDGGPYYTVDPVYPAPNITGVGGWDAALAKAEAFVSQLNLTEKVYMVTGVSSACVGTIMPIPRLNFSGLCLQDGPAAIRQADLASAFPAGLTAAATWDKGLIYQRGNVMAQEFRAKGAHVILGPVCGPLGRHSLGGRNWEGFSPDPYLTGISVANTIQGIQDAGVQACVKHYIGNEQETQRNPSTDSAGVTILADSANIQDRTIHELYLWPFANSVKAGASAIMCSYNRINQTYACQNSKTLNGLLKDELGFQGYVMSDWGGTHSSSGPLNGQDMDMPGYISSSSSGLPPSYFGGNLTTYVQNGTIPEARLDDMVRRVLTPYYYLGQDQNYPTVDPSTHAIALAGSNQYQLPIIPARDVRGDHNILIREIGAAAVVLLKNSNNALPLQKPANIAVFGNDAADVTTGLATAQNASIGTLMLGGGSGTARASYIVSPLAALMVRAQQDGTRIQYTTDNTYLAEGNLGSLYPLPDVCLVFLKTYASEGSDRSLYPPDWNSTFVVDSITKVCNNTVVVTHSAGPNTFPWADNPNVTAILAAHLPGEESGNSIVDVLYGDVNPSGHLPFTIARNQTDYNAPILNLTNVTDPNAWQDDFVEELFIDYRHFDQAGIEPLYEFGFGLSYTTFSMSGLSVTGNGTSVSSAAVPATSVSPGGNPALWETLIMSSVTVTNTGSLQGAAVPQLYIGLPQSSVPSGTPVRQLRGFEKINLDPGQSSAVQMPLMRRDLSYWDIDSQQWLIPSGAIEISVGFSSRDLQLNQTVTLVS